MNLIRPSGETRAARIIGSLDKTNQQLAAAISDIHAQIEEAKMQSIDLDKQISELYIAYEQAYGMLRKLDRILDP